MKALMVVTDGYEELEAIGTLAILRRGGVDLTFASLHKDKARGRYDVLSSNMVDSDKLNLDEYSCLIIPGGPEYIAEERDSIFLDMIKKFYKENKIIAAICAGPTILGHLDMLKNRRYTCFESMNEDFNGTYTGKYVTRDENIITGKSAAATIEFAFEILEALKGKNVVKQVKESIYYRP